MASSDGGREVSNQTGVGPGRLTIREPELESRGQPDFRRLTSRELDIQDYLDAAVDAANRSRSVTITMVVACTLVFVAVVNSLQNAWMLQRIHAANEADAAYVSSKIGALPPHATEEEREARQKRYEAFYSSMWKSYIDNSYYVRVPFFGFALDANDIGVFAGMAFLVILMMMRFCLAREIENLRGSFHRVTDPSDRYEFYSLLAMRQVFTVPRTELVSRSWFAAVSPKIVWLAPFVIQSLVALHDYRTNAVGQQIDDLHTVIILGANMLAVGFVLLFTVSVIRRMLVIDRLWDRYWDEILESGITRPSVVHVPTISNDPVRWLWRTMKRDGVASTRP